MHNCDISLFKLFKISKLSKLSTLVTPTGPTRIFRLSLAAKWCPWLRATRKTLNWFIVVNRNWMVTQKSKRYTFWKFANSTIFRGSPPPLGVPTDTGPAYLQSHVVLVSEKPWFEKIRPLGRPWWPSKNRVTSVTSRVRLIQQKKTKTKKAPKYDR